MESHLHLKCDLGGVEFIIPNKSDDLMALFNKVRIVYLIFILVFCNKCGKVLANLRSFPDSSGFGKVPDIRVIPSTYEESISNYQENSLFELGSDSRLFGKYQVYAIGFIG